MRCQIGAFTWYMGLDGECPNHGLRDRWGKPRTAGAFCGAEGPEDRHGTPILGCCSVVSEDDSFSYEVTREGFRKREDT